jgi:hypothetical protein
MLVNIIAFIIGCIVSALIIGLRKREKPEDSKGTLYILCSDDGEVYAMGEFYSDPANLNDGEMIIMECRKLMERQDSRKDQTL